MAGGNRAFTLQDALGQLNGELGEVSSDDSFELNQLAVAVDLVGVGDSVALTTGATSFNWDASGANWGTLPWS